jgi:MFS family permease
MLALNAEHLNNNIGGLGSLLLASSLASLVSGYVWGRLADISSRKVLLLSGFSAGLSLLLTVIAASYHLLEVYWVLPTLLFALMVAYEGVRMGRSIHLVDIADQDKRAIYTALSNSIIGLFLLLGGLFSIVSHWYGEQVVLLVFALMSFSSMISAYLMKEAQ